MSEPKPHKPILVYDFFPSVQRGSDDNRDAFLNRIGNIGATHLWFNPYSAPDLVMGDRNGNDRLRPTQPGNDLATHNRWATDAEDKHSLVGSLYGTVFLPGTTVEDEWHPALQEQFENAVETYGIPNGVQRTAFANYFQQYVDYLQDYVQGQLELDDTEFAALVAHVFSYISPEESLPDFQTTMEDFNAVQRHFAKHMQQHFHEGEQGAAQWFGQWARSHDVRQFTPGVNIQETINDWNVQAANREMTVMNDLVLNHVSVAHPWAVAERAVVDYLRPDPKKPDISFDWDTGRHNEHGQPYAVVDAIPVHSGKIFRPLTALGQVPQGEENEGLLRPYFHKEDNGPEWNDVQEFRWEQEGHARVFLTKKFQGVISHFIGEGARGIRVDAAYKMPNAVYKAFMQHIRHEHPDMFEDSTKSEHTASPFTLLMETVGGPHDQISSALGGEKINHHGQHNPNNLANIGGDDISVIAMESIGHWEWQDNADMRWVEEEQRFLADVADGTVAYALSHDSRSFYDGYHHLLLNTELFAPDTRQELEARMMQHFAMTLLGGGNVGSMIVAGQWNHLFDKFGTWRPVALGADGEPDHHIDEKGVLQDRRFRESERPDFTTFLTNLMQVKAKLVAEGAYEENFHVHDFDYDIQPVQADGESVKLHMFQFRSEDTEFIVAVSDDINARIDPDTLQQLIEQQWQASARQQAVELEAISSREDCRNCPDIYFIAIVDESEKIQSER